MLSGYLIIYNIFYISVNGDIKFYGLLKTIGTTNKQLKRIVRCQAFLLALIGIPVGLAVGYGISALIVPMVLSITSIEDNIMSISPLIFIGSGIFTLITVWISCIKPCKLVSRISPVEATRYTAVSSDDWQLNNLRRCSGCDKSDVVFYLPFCNYAYYNCCSGTAYTVGGNSYDIV